MIKDWEELHRILYRLRTYTHYNSEAEVNADIDKAIRIIERGRAVGE